MANKTTRKGLALAAAGSLALTGLVGTPAQAAGLYVEGYVTLAPTSGDEYYVLTGNAKEFSLSANFANAAEDAGEYLKFLVVNADEDIVVDDAKSSQYSATATNANIVIVNAGGVDGTDRVTHTVTAHNFKVGDIISVANGAGAVDLAAAAIGNQTVAAVDTNTVSYDVPAGTYADQAAADAAEGDVQAVFKLRTPAYTALTDSFVFNTKSDSNNADKVLVLETGNITTARTATVTAWVDSNDNGKIDATEYVSPTRTVNWLTAADVEAVTTITYPTAADASVSAAVVLTPNLNGDQLAAGDIQIGFTRPGSTATVYANATQAAVARTWSATQSLATGNWVGMPHIGQIKTLADGDPDLVVELDKNMGLGVGDVVDTFATTSADNVTTAGADPDVTVAQDADTLKFELDEDDTAGAPAAQAAAAGYVQVESRLLDKSEATLTKAIYTTVGAHQLSVGDIVTIDASVNANANQLDIARAVVSAVPAANVFEVAGTFVVDAEDDGETGTVTYVSFEEAVPGTYSAKTKVATVVRGNTSTNVTVANTSDDTSLSTTATANVQGATNTSADDTTTSYVRKAETQVELTATIVDEDDVAVSAGRTVKVSLENLAGGGVKSGTFKIDGTAYTTAVYLKTDADGKVTFTVSDDDGAIGTQVRVLVVPENLTGAKTADMELVWANPTYTILDLNDNAAAASTGHNSVVSGGTYTYSLSVMDQFKAVPAAGTHRVKYVTTGNTVETNYVTLTNGAGTYSVTDNSVGAGSSISTAFTLEKLGTDGVTWTAQDLLNDGDADGTADTVTYTTSVVGATATFSVLLDADGSTAYGAGAAADLSDVANTVQLEAQDRRTANLTQPAYTASNRVTGRVANATTNAPRAGAEVTITGPASILFSEGAVDALGSLTVKTDASGEFGIDLYSTTVQTDTVITVTSGAASKTVKVSFTGQGASFGTAWAITAPTNALPGSTFQVKAKLTDKYGNPVQVTTAGDVKVTYTGPGLIVGTLPNTTDKDGELSFSVLLGSNDKGTASVTVSYDQNSDDDFLDAKDLVTTAAITVGSAAATAPATGDTKVNAGSFKGYVALYAKGYAGKRMSAKVGNDWVVVPVLASNFERVVEYTGAGYTVAVRIYIDRVLIDTITVTTK